MAVLALAAVGAAAGYAIAGTAIAASVGWAIGSYLGQSLSRKNVNNAQPLIDVRITGTDYGQPILWAAGTVATAGQLIWNTSPARAITTTTSEGGKGGGGVTTSTNTYEIDALYMLGCVQGKGVARVWANGKLIYTVRFGDPIESIAASAISDYWRRITFYDGNDTQLPDPTYEAAVGVGNAPAYRGRSTVFIEGLQLGQSGQLPNLVFEFVVDGDFGGVPDPRTADVAATLNVNGALRQLVCVDPITNWVWHAGPNLFNIGALNVTVISDKESAVIETFAEAGYPTSAITPGTVFAVPHLREVWVICRPWPFPNPAPHFAVFDSGTVDANGNTVTLPTFKEWVVVDAGLDYQMVAMYEPTQGLVFCAGSSTNTTVCQVTVINPTHRIVHAKYSTGVAIGSPVMISGEYPALAIYGELGNVLNPNVAIIDAGLHLLLYTGRVDPGSSLQPMAFDPNANVWWSVGGSSVDYQTIDITGTVTDHTLLPAPDADLTPTPSDSFLGVAYSSELRMMVIAAASGGGGEGNTLYLVDPLTHQTQYTFTYETSSLEYMPPLLAPGIRGARYMLCLDRTAAPNHVKRMYYHAGTIAPGSITVEEAQRRVCLRAGLDATQFDVTPLASIARPVRGLLWSDVSNARSISEVLMSAYFYEAVLSGDKIKFVPRGSASVATLTLDDLGAHASGEQFAEPFELKRNNDIEIPSRIAITYPNADFDYQSDTQYSDRMVSAADDTTNAITLPLVLQPGEAKAVADTMMLDQAASIMSAPLAMLGFYTGLEPTDCIQVTAGDGSAFRMRLIRRDDQFPLLKFDAVLDETSVLQNAGITSVDYSEQTTVATPAATVLELMDIPILLDAHDDAGFYAAIDGASEPYPGAAVYKSSDGTTYALQKTIVDTTVMGRLASAMAGWTGGRVFDEISTVRVNVGDGVLNSTTRESMLADESVNAALIGDDHLLQFRSAVLVSPGVYDLSGFLHADHGMTSVAQGHVAGERFVLLGTSGVRRIPMDTAELGIARFWKGVTLGRALGTASPQTFVNNGIGLKPLSPFDLRAARDGGGNITYTWQRRSRLSTRTVGPLPIYVPLGEASERYEVDILNGSTVVRTITATTPTVAYSAANQTTDFGSPQASVKTRVYQMSEAIGRGYQLEATV